jgi:sugar lactone lactonase YvrE
LFVANCSGSILRLTPAGVGSTFLSGGLLNCPNGLAADDEDNLYAANFNNGTIIKITLAAVATNFASTPGGATKPGGSNGHIIFANERLYVVSNAAHQVFEIDVTTQAVTLIAGSGTQGRADRPLLEADFYLPNGIAISPFGTKLYVNDSEPLDSNNNIGPNSVRVVNLENVKAPFSMNAGLNDAWVNPATDGQDFFTLPYSRI